MEHKIFTSHVKSQMSHVAQRGASFVEMIVVVSIFTIIVAAVMSAVVFFYRTNAYSIEQSSAVSDGRKGIESMVRDIREATYSETGAFPIESMGANSLTFFSDIDKDNAVEKITYVLNGDVLERRVVQPSGDPIIYDDNTAVVGEISDDVRNGAQAVPIFSYFDLSGVEILNYTNVADVSFARVNLIVNVNPNRLPNEFTLRSSTTLRNLKVN